MSIINYKSIPYELNDEESVLECLERNNQTVPSSCRNGVCHTCILQGKGDIPADSQKGLSENKVREGFFLSCICRPKSELTIKHGLTLLEAQVIEKTFLKKDVVRLRLTKPADFTYHPGQYITLMKDKLLSRSYSLAGINTDNFLELHIKIVDGGKMSTWVFESLNVADKLNITYSSGECFYVQNNKEQTTLLAGTGTGLAPLVGIARDMIAQGHSGEIHLFHGNRSEQGLYLDEELRQLAKDTKNLHYYACLKEESDNSFFETGTLQQVIMRQLPNLKEAKAFLCGNPDFVKDMKKKCYLLGMKLSDIHCDPFVLSSH